ncbi:NB-ARC domain-containing protein [Microbacterium sp. X-17]|uniref:ATP-binding protein n=1 Tax=Microbacterium sp. X-17 TaxID=3144404 RepID=UPI0031F4A5A8
MRLRFFGGLAVEADGVPVEVRGRGQEALLFRLALDAGTTVGYRALAEDVWPDDPPEDPKAALQSLASRLRRALPGTGIDAVAGGYRLALPREDVDVVRFQDLVAAARRETDAAAATALARDALDLWTADPWLPDGFDWVGRDLWEDRGHAERLARGAERAPTGPVAIAEPDVPAALTEPDVPAALTSLVGRERELELLRTQLAAERLVTLLGPGGAGKTTLALETARHEPNVVVVELAPVSAGEVWSAIDGSIGRRLRVVETVAVATSPREKALAALGGRAVLLVLDNCEHVVDEAAGVVVEILRGLPGVRILTTSREPLAVPGEAFIDLGPLSEDDAAELLARRVRAARGTPPDAAEEETVARIVRRLDGLPLAIELAAAKARTLTLAEIEAGLDDRFRLLRAPARVGDARHQTLRALIDWSWDTLTDHERDALLAVAVFPDGVGADDADVIAGAFGVAAADFDALVDRSLLRRAAGRFRMLETVREYGRERLRETGRLAAAQGRQAAVIAEIALARDRRSRGPRVREVVRWFDANEDNLTAATRWCASEDGDPALGVLLTRAQLWIWLIRERFVEAQAALGAFGEAASALDSEASVTVSTVAFVIAAMGTAAQGEVDDDRLAEFTVRSTEIADAAERHPSELTQAIPVILRGVLQALATGGDASAWSASFVVDETAVEGAPPWTRAFVAVMSAALAQNEGHQSTLGAQSERALAMFVDVGDPWGIALASQMRSEWLVLEGRLDEALAVTDDAAPGMAGLASVADLLQQRAQGISILMRLGRVEEARERLGELQELGQTEGSDRTNQQLAGSLAALELAAGDGGAALAALDAVPRDQPQNFPAQVTAWTFSKRAQALALLGRSEEAGDAVRIAAPLAVRSGDKPILADTAVAVAAWFAASGDAARAWQALALSDAFRGAQDRTDPYQLRLRASLPADAASPGPDPDPGDTAALLALVE